MATKAAHAHSGSRMGTVRTMIWTLTPVSVMTLLAAMLVYPLALWLSYRSMPSLSNLTFQLSFAHIVPDIVAGMFAAWFSSRISSNGSVIGAPWIAGAPLRHNAVPMLKIVFLAGVFFAVSVVPMVMTCEEIGTFSDIPWALIASGCLVVMSMAAMGYVVGRLTGSRWSTVIVGVIVVVVDWVGVFLLQYPFTDSGVQASSWGDSKALVFPILPGTVGEPGMRLSSAALMWQMLFRVALIAICVAACVWYESSWREGIAVKAVALASFLVVIALVSVAVSSFGPKVWRRAEPFTPVCESGAKAKIAVCSYPSDALKRKQYMKYVDSVAQWGMGSDVHDDFVVLLGNAFVPATRGGQWNVDGRGNDMIRRLGSNVIRLDSDADGPASNFSEFTKQYTDAMNAGAADKDAPSAHEQQGTDKETLDTADRICDYINAVLPQRMSDLAAYEATGESTRTYIEGYSGKDKVHTVLAEVDDSGFRAFYQRHHQQIQQRTLTAEDVLHDNIAQEVKD